MKRRSFMSAAILPKKTSSGEHPEVKALRAKFRSISDNEGQRLKKLNEKLGLEVARIERESGRPDPRREGTGNTPVPVDVVAFLPSEPPTKKVPR